MKRILVIEDDPAVALGVQEALRQEHFHALVAENGERGMALALRENLDAVVLDLLLPDMRGEDVLARIRSAGNTVPVLILSSKKAELDIVTLLEMGADDYVTKPFKVRVLIAHLRAIVRRGGDLSRELDEYTFSDVHIDFKRQEARRGPSPVRLSSREYQVLRHLVLHEGEVTTRDQLLNEVWGYDQFPTTRTVDNYILSLRKKLEPDPAQPRHILTVHTSGYRFVRGDPPSASAPVSGDDPDPPRESPPPNSKSRQRRPG